MRHAFLACAILVASTGLAGPGKPTVDPHLYVLTSNVNQGNSDVLEIESPWTATQNVERIGTDTVVRHFFGLHYVVNRSDGTIQVIDPARFKTILTFSVGAASTPQDILVVTPDRAYVSRYDSALLYEVDPSTGSLLGTVDLGPLADEDGLPEMSMMALDGNHLFVQIQRIDRGLTFQAVPPSYLAVIDVTTNELIDADPAKPGVQGVVLEGTIPSFRMHVDPVYRRLFVSAPGSRLAVSGGIEEIDLDALQSLGFILSEALAGVDLGGFVMVSPDRGYVIAHTDIVASSHLTAFDRDPSAPGQGEIYTSLYVHNDRLAYDAATNQLFFPEAEASDPGIHVFDTLTNERLTDEPVATGRPPVDLIVVRPDAKGR